MAKMTQEQRWARECYHEAVNEFGGLQGWRHMSLTVQRAMVRSRAFAIVLAQDDSIPAAKVIELAHKLAKECEAFFSTEETE